MREVRMTGRVLGLLAVPLVLMTPFDGAVPDGWAALPPLTYSANPIRGVVVDAVTGQPLEGVIIVAQWILYEATAGGQNPRKVFQVLETVSGPDGTYNFPGWGPKPNVPITLLPGYLCCFFTNRDPGLSLFKPGYRPQVLLNQKPFDEPNPIRTSDWNGKTIKLEKFSGRIEQWVREIDLLQSSLSWGHEMDWRQVPRMTLAILEELKTIPYRLSDRVSGPESLGTTMEEVRRFVEGKK